MPSAKDKLIQKSKETPFVPIGKLETIPGHVMRSQLDIQLQPKVLCQIMMSDDLARGGAGGGWPQGMILGVCITWLQCIDLAQTS